MRHDLKTPCKNCPFRTDETAIRFYNRERATEIEEQAYRRGFPCHLSAESREDTVIDGVELDDGGFHATEDSQQCVGSIIMYLKGGEDVWPSIDNDEALGEKLARQIDWNAPVFEGPDAFLDSYGEEE